MSKKDFNIIGEKIAGKKKGRKESVESFISGEDPQVTITVQLLQSLKYSLKREALEQKTTIKDILIKILKKHFNK